MKTMLENLYRELNQVLEMTEEEVMDLHEETKEECIASYKAEIHYYEKELSLSVEEDSFNDGLDPAFSSWEEVNAMFV